FKPYARDPLDFRLAVTHGVDRNPRARWSVNRPRLAKISTAQEFAHDHNVGAAHNLAPQRRSVLERRKEDRRTQIGIRAQLAPYTQQSSLRTQVAGIVIEGRTSDRAQ